MPNTWRVDNNTQHGGEATRQWQANHAYSLGARCVASYGYGTAARKGLVFECTTAGTSHAATEPTWPTVGSTVADGAGTLVWTARSPSDGNWDNASCYLMYLSAYQSAVLANGDTVLVHNAHSNAIDEPHGVLTQGSFAAPLYIYCVNKADDSLSAGAKIQCSGSINLAGVIFSYGVEYRSTNWGVKLSCLATGSTYYGLIRLESDGAHNVVYAGDDRLSIEGGTYSPFQVEIVNGHIELNHNYAISIGGAASDFLWCGGQLKVGTNLNNGLFNISNPSGFSVILRDVDLTALAAYKMFADADNYVVGYCEVSRCKLHASFDFISAFRDFTVSPHRRYKYHHCSDGNKTYQFLEKDYKGTICHETTLIRTGGASDGTTGLSWKIVTTNKCVETLIRFECPAIHGWTGSTSTKTFTIEGLWDSAANIQDDEVWMELEYPKDALTGIGTMTSDKVAVKGTPADQATSAATWTTTGMANPNAFKLSVTVTPGKAGPITARVFVAKPSATIYIDPKITES